MRGLRRPAIRISIEDFTSAEVEEQSGRFTVIVPQMGPIDRVCLFGTVTEKITGANDYVGLRLDDGKGECWLKCWDGSLSEIDVWEQVEIVGRVRVQMRENIQDLYIQNEIINRIIDPNWEIMHRLEVLKTGLAPPTDFGAFGEFQLASEFDFSQEDIGVSGPSTQPAGESSTEEKVEDDVFIQKLETLIHQLESDKGVSYDKLRQSIKQEEEAKLDDALFKLLIEGKIYEPTPARYKTLK